jgi:hypothetical protein
MARISEILTSRGGEIEPRFLRKRPAELLITHNFVNIVSKWQIILESYSQR